LCPLTPEKGQPSFVSSMDERRYHVALDVLWTKVFQIGSRRDIVITSVVGLCGLGLFFAARRCLAPTPSERQLLQEAGNFPTSRPVRREIDRSRI